jgi:hypothetical protein
MHVVYIRYRNLKRTVRDEAAIDIQRAFRGMRVRIKYQLKNKSSKINPKKSHLHGIQSPSSSEIQRNKLSKKQSYDNTHSSSEVAHADLDLFSMQRSTSLGSVGSSTVVGSGGNNSTNLHTNNNILVSVSDLDIGTGTSGVLPGTNQPRKRKGFEITRSLNQPPGQFIDSYTEWLTTSQRAADMRTKFIELHQKKHHLKSVLKRFDEEFNLTHGRLPLRKDKEVSRFYYKEK